MAKIHGIAYILVGALVSFVSWKIDFNDLMIFFYAGIGFAVVGLFKIFISLARKNEEYKSNNSKVDEKQHHLRHLRVPAGQRTNNPVQHHARVHPAQRVHPNQRPVHSQQHSRPSFKRCQNCGNAARITDNFCSNCGYNV